MQPRVSTVWWAVVAAWTLAGCDCGGIDRVQAGIATAPTRLDFGEVKLDGTATRSLRIDSTERGALELASITLTSGNAPGGAEAFQLVNPPTVIQGLSSAPLQVRFRPTVRQLYVARITIASNAGNQRSLEVLVSGEGVVPEVTVTPECSADAGCQGGATVSPPALDFGQEPVRRPVPIDPTRLPSVNFVNTGPVDLVVSRLAIEGADRGAFSFAGGAMPIASTSPITLAPQSGRNVAIRFSPDGGQDTYAAQVVLETDDPARRSVTVGLSGRLLPNQPPRVCANLTLVRPPSQVGAERNYNSTSDWAPLLSVPDGGYDFSIIRDVRPNEELLFSALSDPSNDTTCTTDPEDGRTGLTYRWSVRSQPDGGQLPAQFSSGPTGLIRASLAGRYELELAVTDTLGATTVVPIRVLAQLRRDLVAQLTWAGFPAVDLDLHLVRPSAAADPFALVFEPFSRGSFGRTSGDVNSYAVQALRASVTGDFDWGQPGQSDDPLLNEGLPEDVGGGRLEENTTLNLPENDPACERGPCTYRVFAQFYADRRTGTSPACTVTGAPGCRDGQQCTCPAASTCAASTAPRGDAGVGNGSCLVSPRPVLRLYFRNSTAPQATIPLPQVPEDPLGLGAPCEVLYLAAIDWPARLTADGGLNLLPDGGKPFPAVRIPGLEDGGTRITSPLTQRFGLRSTGSRSCEPDIQTGGYPWFSPQP